MRSRQLYLHHGVRHRDVHHAAAHGDTCRAVDDARIVTANPEWFERRDVATACLVLQAWGDEYDMLAGDAMMLAMEKPKREDYRAELPGLLIFAALTVGMMFAILGVGQ